MALSLTAEQKNILKIFKIEEQYMIPSYQRPYSWEYDQCYQLYTDLMRSFDNDEDYFIGNIITAKSESNHEYIEVVDGQQRLITLLLFIKVLSVFQQDLKILFQLISKEDWRGNNNVPRIRTEVFETNDGDAFNKVMEFNLIEFENLLRESIDKSGKILEKRINDKFATNALYFYNWLVFFQERKGNLENFTYYLLQKTFLLPIELGGKTQDEANEKALVIFETINNRGMNLEDADIFKAKLFNKAKKIGEETKFIGLWTDFKISSDNLGLKIDDVFRYYSHIIRGRQGITYGEKNLREFFTREDFSPFELNSYEDVLNDLFKILDLIEFLTKSKIEPTQITPWLQVLSLYTNQYPNYAIVNYLYINGVNLTYELVEFLKALLRFVYYQGSTSTVKFEIYNIIKQVSQNQTIGTYLRPDIKPNAFDNTGRLKRGFSLLAYYLQGNEPLSYYVIDRILSKNDRSSLAKDWDDIDFEEVLEDLGNYIVIGNSRKNLPFERKLAFYLDSGSLELKEFIENDFMYSDFYNREVSIKDKLVRFFSE